jgi:hypothetical protein
MGGSLDLCFSAVTVKLQGKVFQDWNAEISETRRKKSQPILICRLNVTRIRRTSSTDVLNSRFPLPFVTQSEIGVGGFPISRPADRRSLRFASVTTQIEVVY